MEQNTSQIQGEFASSEKCAAYSGADSPNSASPPPDLALVIERWPTLTAELRARIVSLMGCDA